MIDITCNLDLELKDIDSLIRSHNINNCDINRRIRAFIVQFGDLLELLLSCAWIDNIQYARYSTLINNRLKKLDNIYYCKE